ncbi:hypothetical protein VHEMI00352 [[Torrubiella] hemipterigena]|uniref:Aminotransferase n=1 Tax=[Torrubiella] hemipterigena TaxID=1531966 RepID=A0A0A1SJ62_9HYPO|nr:hypothetical protein VHEMI00352 [[Torrubiella] hemipterigena]
MAPHKNDESPASTTAPAAATPKGSKLMNRSFKVEPELVVSAKGIHLHLADGRTIIDGCGGAAVTCIGHGNEEVIEAMYEQSKKVSYVHTQSYVTSSAQELADFLLEGNPYGLEKAFFVGSGSEAVESAMKLAKQHFYELGETQRVHFVSRRQAYHGNSMGSMSITSHLLRKRPYNDYGHQHVSHVTPAFAYRYMKDGETESQFSQRLVQELEDEFLRVGPEKVIAFVAETIGGALPGCVAPPAGYFQGVRRVCDKYGILLIMDEIMCGTGRSGTFFAFEPEGASPDIMTVAKGLGGGYATIAAVLATGKALEPIRRGSSAFNSGHTYQAHPLACAAALAVQKIIRRDGLVERCAKMGLLLEQKLRAQLAECRSVGDIRGRGLFWAVEFVKDAQTKETFDPSLGYGTRVQQAAFQMGVALYPGWTTVDGVRGDHVLFAPPFTVTEEELDTIVDVAKRAILSQEAQFL